MISTRSKYQNYKSFANARIDQLFTPEQLKGAQILKANYLESSYLKNNGNGKFELSTLPTMAQVSILNGMEVDDFDGDGNLDILINGNDYGTEVSVGRYDAMNGLLLKGDGRGGFLPLSILESGIFIPGNGKALVKLKSANGGYLIAASQNKSALKVFELKNKERLIALGANDVSANISFKNGKGRKLEFYYGSSFLSQSGRFIRFTNNIKSITVTDSKGEKRMLP